MEFGKMMIFVFDKFETLWEKVKMLVTCIFSFSHNVFKRLFTQGRQKSGLYGKELKAFADHNVIVAKKIISVFDRIEAMCEKEKILVTSIFPLFPQCFHKASPLRLLNVRIVLKSWRNVVFEW